MNVQSLAFLAFLTVAVCVCRLLPKERTWVLLAASLVFYLWGGAPAALWGCGLLAVSSFVSYLAASALRNHRRKSVLLAVVCYHIAVLGIFKYTGFFTGGAVRMPFVPLGISFFTFQQIWYLREVYAGTFSQVPTPAEYLTYSFFFPTVSSGPILKPENFFPQLREASPLPQDTAAGLYAIGLGLAKKVLLADNLGVLVNNGWSSLSELTALTAWCVILYSTGNEVSETAQPKGIFLTGELTRYLHSLDATRPVTCGVNIFFNFLSSMGFGVYSDEKAKKELESSGKKKKAVGSEFYNNLAGLMGANTMKIGATLHGCDVRTRGAFAKMDFAGYNYGILRYEHDLKKYPERLILGTETFCDDAYRFWEQAKTEKRLLGDFVWAGIDYLGEVGVGSWEYADYAPDFSHGPGWMTAGSGRIDLTGSELAEADYTRVAFELEQGPILAVRPLGHEGKHSPSAWKMTNARRSWSWRGCSVALL